MRNEEPLISVGVSPRECVRFVVSVDSLETANELLKMLTPLQEHGKLCIGEIYVQSEGGSRGYFVR